MDLLPLLSHPAAESVVAWRHGQPITRQQFLAHAERLAAALPAGRHFVNACTDRYRFAVALAAGLISDRTALLPSSFNPTVAGQLAEFAADSFVIGDSGGPVGTLPWFAFTDETPPANAGPSEVPTIAADRRVAWVFTSGSTGTPLPHPKCWGKLVANVRYEAAALGLAGHQPPFNLIGTVPPQHMYGLESTVMMALQGGGALVAERPFFPADIARLVAATRRPRVLVTTPFHLRNLLAAEIELAPLDLLVSATAPLEPGLAAEAEAVFGCALLEIFGSTETGQFATRRSSAGEAWTLFPEVMLEQRDGAFWAAGGHIESPVALSDLILAAGPRQFRVGGRNADLVNIAGKRSSLAYLNHQLLAIPGVTDGAFFMPDERPDSVARPAAFAVAPGLSAERIQAALRERIDAVFLPRPLILLDALPRNATGKLPRAACEALLAAHPGGRRR